MRTLSEITAAVRQGNPTTADELRYAVVAYDVMVAQMELPNDPKRLFHYFQAADNDPREYIGRANDPALPDARKWYAAMHGAGGEKPTLDQFETCGACEGVGLYNAGLGQTRNCNTCKGSGVVPANVCPNCDTALPKGCGGLFEDDGTNCWRVRNVPPEG